MSQKHHRIALVMPYRLAYCRGILRGITSFARSGPDWILSLVDTEQATRRLVRQAGFDGVIVHIFSRRTATLVRGLGCPIINVVAGSPDTAIPSVGVDNRAVGRMAADHLLGAGLRHFAFVGYPTHAFSVQRGEGFTERVRSLTSTVHTCQLPLPREFDPGVILSRPNPRLMRWLQSLPKPVGIFTSDDVSGLRLTELCRSLDLRIPDQVAIVGVDNDDLLCEMSRPPLSSVALPTERVGFEAASRLEQLLRGRRRLSSLVLPPAAVVPRRSSELVAADDPDVADALRFIRDNTHRPINVSDILAEIPVSRSSLERKFRRVLGCSPLSQIQQSRVGRARRLLATTQMPIAQIAMAAGFTQARQLSTVFRLATSLTPSEYRRQTRPPTH